MSSDILVPRSSITTSFVVQAILETRMYVQVNKSKIFFAPFESVHNTSPYLRGYFLLSVLVLRSATLHSQLYPWKASVKTPFDLLLGIKFVPLSGHLRVRPSTSLARRQIFLTHCHEIFQAKKPTIWRLTFSTNLQHLMHRWNFYALYIASHVTIYEGHTIINYCYVITKQSFIVLVATVSLVRRKISTWFESF